MGDEQFMETLSEAVTITILEKYMAYYGNPLGVMRGSGLTIPGKEYMFKQTFTSGEHTVEIRVSSTVTPTTPLTEGVDDGH